MKRPFKNMAQAEAVYSEQLKRLDLNNIALDAVFNNQVTWHKKAEAKKLGVQAVGWARLASPHGDIALLACGNQRVAQSGASDGRAYYLGAAEKARAERAQACHTDIPGIALDVRVQHEGTLYLFHPNTEAAETWLRQNVESPAQWLGKALVVDHRYARDFAHAVAADGGFSVGGDL